MLRSRLKGPVDIMLQNKAEFDNFTNQGAFTKAHLATLVNAVYCPQGHLNAIYSNIARKTQRYVISNSPNKMI